MAAAKLFVRLRRLSPREQRLVAAAWVGLAVVRPALAFLPFRLLRAWAECEPARRRAEGHPDPERAAALVEAAAAHHLLATTCLARALVLCRLLRRRGFPARLYVGASRTGELFEAHAWVTCGDCALTAGRAIERFEALLPEAPATAAEGR